MKWATGRRSYLSIQFVFSFLMLLKFDSYLANYFAMSKINLGFCLTCHYILSYVSWYFVLRVDDILSYVPMIFCPACHVILSCVSWYLVLRVMIFCPTFHEILSYVLWYFVLPVMIFWIFRRANERFVFSFTYRKVQDCLPQVANLEKQLICHKISFFL